MPVSVGRFRPRPLEFKANRSRLALSLLEFSRATQGQWVLRVLCDRERPQISLPLRCLLILLCSLFSKNITKPRRFGNSTTD